MDDAEEAAIQATRSAEAAANNGNNNITDNEATNCSETMSTNDEEYNLDNLEQTGSSDQYQALINVTSSIKNRISTPRRVLQQQNQRQQQVSNFNNCNLDYNRASDREIFTLQQQQQQQQKHQQQQQQSTFLLVDSNQDYETTETNTPSLASACQAPPSYGTATRGDGNVTDLDVEQLNNVLGNCSIILPDLQQQLSPQISTNNKKNQRHQSNYTSANTCLTGQALLNANPTGSSLVASSNGEGATAAVQKISGNEGQQVANSKSPSLFCESNSSAGNISSKTIGISRTIESLARLGFDEQQRQQQQQQQHYQYQQHQSKHQKGLQSEPYSFFNVVNNGTDTRQKDTQQQHNLLLASYEQQGTSQLSAYLSSSASLPRIQLVADLNGQALATTSSSIEAGQTTPTNNTVTQVLRNQAASFGKTNVGLDNNQASSLKWQNCQQQQLHQMVATKMFVRDPINHVISARESMQWKPQTNQYYATSFNSTRTLPAGSSNFLTTSNSAKSMLESQPPPAVRVLDIRANQQKQQQQQHLGIMGAADAFNVSTISHNSPHWPFNGAGSITKDTHNEQAAGSTISNAAFSTSSNSSTLNQLPTASGGSLRFPRSISTVVGPKTRSSATSTTATMAPFDCSAVLLPPGGICNGKQASQQIYGPPTTGTTIAMMATHLRRSDENLNRTSKKHRDQAAQHRKRRRHRSTSGRSLSPVESGKRIISNLEANNTNNYTNCAASTQLSSNSNNFNDNNADMLKEFPIGAPERSKNVALATTTTADKSNYQQQQQQQQQHKTISAHCWLIDSSDDQAEASRKDLKQCTQKSRRIDHHHQQQQQQPPSHLTVAMMRQSEQQAQRMVACKQQKQQQQSGKKRSEQDGPSSSTTDMLDQANRGLTLACKTYDKDLTSNLKTNSLKLERILSRNNCNNANANNINNNQPVRCARVDSQFRIQQPISNNLSACKKATKKQSTENVSKRKSSTVPRRMRLERHSLSASSSSVPTSPETSSASSLPSCNNSERRSPTRQTYHAHAVLRLSALLSMILNLVKRGPKCLKVGSMYTSSASQNHADSSNRPSLHCLASANSISGSMSAPSVNLAPYTAASLAISSSSSTSAYATGSSHLSSNLSNPPAARIFAANTILSSLGRQNSSGINTTNKPIGLTHFKVPPSSASTAGSSLFYSSSAGSALQHGHSSHGYEYCDTDIQIDETKLFNQQNTEDVPIRIISIEQHQQNGQRVIDGFEATTGRDPSPANSNLASLERSSTSASSGSQGLRASALQQAAADKELRHIIMSDNELISAGSDLNNNDAANTIANAATTDAVAATAGFNLLSSTVLPSSLVQNSAPSAARRRWWWNSLKDWLRRPCKSGSSDFDCNIGANQADQSTAARYKSLRSSSRRTGYKMSDRSSSSTIQNVISLAKADRVFRIRLIASIIVSCILLGLLCALITMLYWRSNHSLSSLYQNNRLNFLIDDSDYDLSWLWAKNVTLPSSRQSVKPIPMGNAHKTFSYQANNNDQQQLNGDRVKTLEEQQIDNSLKAQIIMIEQSERLNQHHETITFLTNIQLANDNFIDINQLAKQLIAQQQRQSENYQQNSNNLNRTDADQINATKLGRSDNTSKSNYRFYLSDLDRDLVGLTLLSNLHWPLVKWRHQNQRSMANFLSFSVSPSLFGGSQTLKNFLSLLILVETMNDHSPPIMAQNNLKQFLRLHSLLKSASYHLVFCSYLMQNDRFLELNSLKSKFCQQLVNGYKRLMSTLSQLDHHHLSKFNNPLEQSPLISGSQEEQQQQQFKHMPTSSSSRTLLGFFLDRLALLDVENIAEATLATSSHNLDNANANLIQLINLSTSPKQSEKLPLLNSKDSDRLKSSLLDLTKQVVGESPMNLNLNLEKNRDFQQRFQQLEADNGDAWREMLVQDLLYPWASYKLSRFVIPNNYDVFFHPNLTTHFISGMVKIEFKVERATRFIVINCDNLNIVDLSLMLKQSNQHSKVDSFRQSQNYSNTMKPIEIRRILLNTKLEQLYIELYDPIVPFATESNNMTNKHQDMLPIAEQEQARAINFGELPIYDNNNYNNNNNINNNNNALLDEYNNYVINISFNKTNLMSSGHFKDSSGLKFIQYGDYFAQPEAEVKIILYTQFEPTNARKVFPCFDEPQLKAKVQLNLVHEQNYQVLFNAPKREKIPFSSDGLIQMSVFESTSIPISTYLISFIVCDSQNIKSITSRVPQLQIDSRGFIKPQQTISGDQQKYIQVQILANFEHLSQAEYSSQLVPQLLAFYQNYLQFPYPSDKLDLIALPKRLPFEATVTTNSARASSGSPSIQIDTMENLGLIWFKEPLLLMDTNLISQNLIEQVSMIISHQIAHQYFGNIVTIPQWQDLWLYEALCQYLESIALSNVQVDWKLEEQFVVTTIQETLALEQFDTPLDYSSSFSSSDAAANAAAFPSNSAGNRVPLSMPTVPLDLLVSPSNVELETYVDQVSASALASAAAMVDSKNISDLEPDSQALEGSQDNADNTTYLLRQSQQQFADRSATTDSSLFNSIELRRSLAILHMLLFNLLPSSESQARLLRRCLDVYKYKTMSRVQFWRLFGEQLAQEASLDRLSLDLTKFSSQNNEVFEQQQQKQHPDSTMDSLVNGMRNKTIDQANHEQHASERVVFVRPASKRQHLVSENEDPDQSGEDMHKIRPRSNRLVDNLGTVVNYWLEQHNYPLVTASAYRDKLHLRQERFSLAWWDVIASGNGGSGSGEISNDDTVHAKWAESSERIEILLPSANSDPTLVKRSPSLPVGQHQEDSNQNVAENSLDNTVWPIPLMFVSRFNPKQAQFFWMDKREMRVPFGDHLSSTSSLMSPDSSSSTVQLNSRTDYSLPDLRSLARGYSNSWFKLNVNQSSLVRVNYDERNWEALTELLVKSHYSNHLLSSLDRANLIDDAFTLMRCGKLSVGIAMNLTLYLEVGEREYMPWTNALKHLDQMQTLLNQNPLWHRYVLKLMQPISSVIGWKDDGPHLMRKLRRSLFSVALQYGDDKIVSKAKGDFKSWFKNGRFIVPNLQELVYVAGVLYGDQQEWFHCWQKYKQLVSFDLIEQDINNNADLNPQSITNATNNVESYNNALRDQRQSQATSIISGMVPASIIGSSEFNEVNTENEKRQLLTALASTHNTWLLEQFLNYSIDSTKIQPHHLKHVVQTLGKNPVARLYLWRFVRLNWANLVDKYMPKPNEQYNSNGKGFEGSSSDCQQILETMIIESTKHFATKLDYDEVKAFFDDKQKQRLINPYLISWSPSVERAIQHSLQIIKSNIYWRNFIEPKLAKWLSHFDSTIIN